MDCVLFFGAIKRKDEPNGCPVSNKEKFHALLNRIKPLVRVNACKLYVTCLPLMLVACSAQVAQPTAGSSVSKYQSQLPATDYSSASSNASEKQTGRALDAENAAPKEALASANVEPAEPTSAVPPPKLSVKPVVLLDHSYTLRLGFFDSSAQASKFITTNNLEANDAGIAKVSNEGALKYLLAYGVYSDKTQAETIAKQMAVKLARPVDVFSLGEIKAISESSQDHSSIDLY